MCYSNRAPWLRIVKENFLLLSITIRPWQHKLNIYHGYEVGLISSQCIINNSYLRQALRMELWILKHLNLRYIRIRGHLMILIYSRRKQTKLIRCFQSYVQTRQADLLTPLIFILGCYYQFPKQK